MHWRAMLFGVNGRIRRSEYWLWSLGSSASIIIIVTVLDTVISSLTMPFLSYVVYAGAIVAWLWKNVCLTAKRWHDRNKSAWMYLIVLLPVIGSVWTFIECGLLDGTAGDNRYGASPKMMHSMPGIF